MLVSDHISLSNDFLFCWVQGLDCYLLGSIFWVFPKKVVAVVQNALGDSWWGYNAVFSTHVIVIGQVEMSDQIRRVFLEIGFQLFGIFHVFPQNFQIVVSVGPGLVDFFLLVYEFEINCSEKNIKRIPTPPSPTAPPLGVLWNPFFDFYCMNNE